MLKVVSYYLAFTMLSITIQFAIIDYIQANSIDLTPPNKDLNGTSQKLRFSDVLRDMKPHALFYQTNDSILHENKLKSTTSAYPNSSVTDVLLESVLPSTTNAYDILLFDENATTTVGSFTSEIPTVTTEFENITGLSIFNKKNDTEIKPMVTPSKKTTQDNCYCNLQYQVCDINCCCDEDCIENERKMFNCTEKGTNLQQDAFFCSVLNEQQPMLNSIDSLFCVAKTNLPEKRNKNFKEYNAAQAKKITGTAFKWHDNIKYDESHVISPKIYAYGDSVKLLRNGSLSHFDLPFSKINNYCDARTPIIFLQEQKVKCNVIIKDLEMFHILKNVEETSVVSFTNMSANSTTWNCSTVHCTNWTVVFCDEKSCKNYNRTLHEPACMDNIMCTNLALNVEYVFNYYDFKITNATLYLHTQNVTPKVPFLVQQVSVKFYLMNLNSVSKVVKLSGHSGYVKQLPVIVSYDKGNYSRNFFNGTDYNYLFYPENKKGICVFTNVTSKIINFGTNKITKCRYIHKPKESVNGTKICQYIQDDIKNLLSINKTMVISPLGNPHDLIDEHWLRLEMDASQQLAYGEFYRDSGVLRCFNIITKLSLVFGYADVSDIVVKENIKIMTATADVTTQNLTFADDNPSVVLTVETAFVDVTKPPVYEYATSPQLNIHLPKDFFFPFPSNKCYSIYERNLVMLLICIVITFIPK